jgi:hypothetical protein
LFNDQFVISFGLQNIQGVIHRPAPVTLVELNCLPWMLPRPAAVRS